MKAKDKILCMEALNHASDISNPIKTFEIYKQWTTNIT